MLDSYSNRKQRIAKLLQGTSGTIRVDDAMRIFKLSRPYATVLLSNWHKQGVLRRVSHGVYVPLNPAAIERIQIVEDPWTLVPELFSPCYIGGWNALEHWELTEQVFRSVCVITAKRTQKKEETIQGVVFSIKKIYSTPIFGTKTIWRGHIKVEISDPHKTILDIIDDPELGAGLQHTFDSFKEYVKTYIKDLERLYDYAEILNKGSLFKKLGYFSELLRVEQKFIDQCKSKLTKGYASLDKNIKNRRLVTRWRLWVPANWVSND